MLLPFSFLESLDLFKEKQEWELLMQAILRIRNAKSSPFHFCLSFWCQKFESKLKSMNLGGILKCLCILFLLESCMASVQIIGRLKPGFKGSQMNYIDNDGLFLVSNNSNFGFGFATTQDVTLFLLVVVHISSSTIVWSANRGSPVHNSDTFKLDDNGNAYLQTESSSSTVWSTNTANKSVTALELQNSGNIVLISSDGRYVWQSFDHPSDALLSNQEFKVGSKLVSVPNSNDLSYSLEIKSGDLILSAEFPTPQPYWTLLKDSRITINKDGGVVDYAVLDANSWKFYDQNKSLLWQFIFSNNVDPNATWVAVLAKDGFIRFSHLNNLGSSDVAPTKIPQNECNRPAACDPYFACYDGNTCQCPSGLPSCKLGNASHCKRPKEDVQLVNPGDGLSYFAMGFVPPSSRTDINGCKTSCLSNCSCLAMFFESSSGNCYMFDQLGSLQSSNNGPGYDTFIKVSTNVIHGGSDSNKRVPVVVAIVCVTLLVIIGLLYGAIHFHQQKSKDFDEYLEETSEDNDFLEVMAGMPMRYSYKDLQAATDNFSIKLGQGGFGSVYQGKLPDGTKLAVKKLEGIGQGKKEFRAEVSIIGSIHHLNLVRLKGFCAEGTHRLLAYEFMGNGSLERWLFKKNKDEFMLDWNTRYNIAVGTAKGLAYLHEDCDVKIVHCDIKPENVLLDDNFSAKVSDFGLAKLMNREQSFVFTTLRGTRGYLAPEWITNYAISEKSDVFSYGMVLLEIIGGRKNYDPSMTSEKSHFPTYAFKKVEEGKLKDIIDSTLKVGKDDERISIAIKVALWCIQDDMYLRPPMTKVVQMLEGVCPVPPLPPSSHVGSKLYSNFLKSVSEGGTSSGQSECNSDVYISDIRLSGPR